MTEEEKPNETEDAPPVEETVETEPPPDEDTAVSEKDTENDTTMDGANDASNENTEDAGEKEESKGEDDAPTATEADKEPEEPVVEEKEESKDEDAEMDAEANPDDSKEPEQEAAEDEDPPTGPTLQIQVDNTPEADADGDDDADDDQAGPTLQFTFQQNTDDVPDPDVENEKPDAATTKKRPRAEKSKEDKEEERLLLTTNVVYEDTNPQTIADKKTVSENKPESALELALTNLLAGKEVHVAKLTNEINKLKGFISKRKQTYKRKRKDEGAPTRALSAYNIFIQDQFQKLAKKNNAALQSTDTNAQLERVPPSNLVASTGGRWKLLPEEEKDKYRERARADRQRYEEQMAKYQPPDKQANRKRNKTGYNMFFSAHVVHLKQSESGVPSERGSVARMVGVAWKRLSAEEKQYYEREADKHNGMNPVDKPEEEEEDDDEQKEKAKVDTDAQHAAQQQAAAAAQQQQAAAQDHYAAHAAQYAGHDLSAATGYAHAMHQAAAQQHDPRAIHHGYYYAQPHPHAYHYDYSGHHAAQQQPPPGGHRASRQQYQYSQYYEK